MMQTELELKRSKSEEWDFIFSFSWELDETNADNTFEPLYKELEDFKWKLIFDFNDLKYINSKTIGYLVDIFSKIEENWWEMYIKNCTWWIKDTLSFTWIDTIIPYID